MTVSFNLCKRLLVTYKSFGLSALYQDLIEIFRQKLFRSRKYILMSLLPNDFIEATVLSPTIVISIVKPEELNSYVHSDLELSSEFLQAIKDEKAVIAKEEVTGDILGYGFYSSKPIAIEGQIFFQPPPGSTYLFKFYIIPQARGERIVRRLIAKVIDQQPPELSKLIIAIVIANNFNSLYSFSAMGFEKKKNFIFVEGGSDTWQYQAA